MTLRKHILTIVILLGVAGTGRAQSYTYTYGGPYYGALEYFLALPTSATPSYLGEPANISADYLLLNLAMTNSSWNQSDSIINQMTWGDTAEYITGLFYQVTHDNPVAFDQWGALHSWSGFGFKNDPGHAIASFESRLVAVCPDTGRTAMLVIPDFIADVMLTDTSSVIDSTAMIAKNMVRADCQLLDTIKGKWLPACTDYSKTRKNSTHILNLGIAGPDSTYAVPAVAGTCLQFEYSLQWRGKPSPTGDVGMGSNLLGDSINGTWVKPDSEYIVFLEYMGLGAGNSTSFCFTVWPCLQGTCSGMYPVHGGIVYDPNDDFGMGANVGLTVAEWKRRLRLRIAVLTAE